MNFFIISWKEFEDRKMTERAEIIKAEDKTEAITKMREFNAQKRLTTTDYQTNDLSALLDKHSLQIVEKVITE
jgi:hypothetical protein